MSSWHPKTWMEEIWPTLCAVSGSDPQRCKLTKQRGAMLDACAQVALDFTSRDPDREFHPERDVLAAYLADFRQVPGLAWMTSPGLESPIKPTKVRAYLEEWDRWVRAGRPPARASPAGRTGPSDRIAAANAGLTNFLARHPPTES